MQSGNMQQAPSQNGQGVPLIRNGSGGGAPTRGGRPINGHGHHHSTGGGRHRRDAGGNNGNQFEGARSPPNNKNLAHVPCKFFRIGQCQAGNACPFSHNFDHGEQPCKYFAKGNCKFGPKCANLHVDQFGRVLNRREKNLAAYNLGGRDAFAYQQQAAAMGIAPEELQNTAPFTNQIGPIPDMDALGGNHTQPYDIPGSQMQFGSSPDDGRLPMSPPPLRTMNEVGLPSSFDSKGSSTFFKHGPIAASVPSKFFALQSPPSSVPRQSMLSGGGVHLLPDSQRPKPGPFSSSPGIFDDEPSAPRMLHSQARHKPRGPGIMSTSLPVQEEWEKDDDDFFGEQEDYVPQDLLNSQIRHKEADKEPKTTSGTPSMSAPRDFKRRDSFRSSAGFGSPEVGSVWGSPSMASPGSSRFMGLFTEQKRKEEQGINGASPFGPVGSPRRSSFLGSSPGAFGQSPPIGSGVSNLTLGLKDLQVGGSSFTDKPNKPAPAPRRFSSETKAPTNRTVSSNSVSQRIDEEPQGFVFALEEDDLNASSKEKIPAGPWGQPIGAGRKNSMGNKDAKS